MEISDSIVLKSQTLTKCSRSFDWVDWSTSLPRRKAVFLLKGCSLTWAAPSAISTPHISHSFSSFSQTQERKKTHMSSVMMTQDPLLTFCVGIRPWGSRELRLKSESVGNGREKRNHGFRRRWSHGGPRVSAPLRRTPSRFELVFPRCVASLCCEQPRSSRIPPSLFLFFSVRVFSQSLKNQIEEPGIINLLIG